MRRLVQALAVYFALTFAAPAFAQDGPIVRAPAGGMQGVVASGVNVFRGIPYAQAPVGDLRWRAPVRAQHWRGVRDATQFGAVCMQPASAFRNDPAMSEDCLFLNIWTPAHARNAPVLVWIHGGSLVSGAGSDGIYDGSGFAAKGIIVVSINYRLGALGWLAHPGLSAESRSNASGNYGLMDQIEALRWVQRNIRSFGGDPRNVTIAGESAGALSVMFLMASPDAHGLFQRAIAQSAYMITMPQLRNGTYADWPDAETIGMAFATAMGASDVSSLRALDAQAIVDGAGPAHYFPLGTVEGRTLPRQLIETFDRGEQAHVPILAGFNEGEIRSLRFLLPPAPADGETYTREIRARYGELADIFLARYPAENIPESMLETTRDAMYGWTAERLVARQTAIGEPSYLYYFDHGYPAADAGGYRAFHAAEIPFVFGTITSTPSFWPAVPRTAGEERLSGAMLSYWASFALTGAPRAEGEQDWRPYGDARNYLAFEETPHMRAGPPNSYELHETVVCRRHAHNIAWHWNVGVIAPPLPPATPGCS